MRPTKRGLTLLELLVAVAITAVLIALLLPAVQKARETGLRLRSQNNVRQISLAVLTYADRSNGRLPLVNADASKGELNVHQAAVTVLNSINFGSGFDWVWPWNPILLSPADPSAEYCLRDRTESGGIAGRPSSYAANAQVFQRGRRYAAGIPDGLSNTIFYAERYALCRLDTTDYHTEGVGFAWNGPGFTEGWLHQVYPIPAAGRLSQPSRPGVTFQVRPLWIERPTDHAALIDLLKNPPPGSCDPAIPQTPHASGMIVGLGDGSVRTVGGIIAPGVFWSLVTPDGGEVLGDW